jgi:RNA polymerase sigma-70 factor, ECF subfamily
VSISGDPMAAADSLVIGGELGRRRPRRPRSEQALIRGVLAGSEADLEALFRRYWPRAYRAAFLIVHDHAAAEDIAQEAFLAAVRRLDRFDRRRRFGPWLSTIVANRAIDWIRARSARHEATGEAAAEAVAETASPPPDPPVGRYSQELLNALASLSPEHRAVIVMRYLLEYSPGEIARALELPRGTVNSRLRRGLDALEARLGDVDPR